MLKLFKQKQKSKNSMYDEIVSWDNICQAYLDLYGKFTEKCKSHSYKGIDGQNLSNAEINVEDLLKTVQEELQDGVKLHPARYFEIPKKDGGIRGTYSLTVKDRIKCQAVLRQIEPLIEAEYSDYVYSFRSDKASYYASRSVRRFYLRNYGTDYYVLRMDIKKYADYVDHKFMMEIFAKMGLEEKVLNLIYNIIKQPFIKNGTIMSYRRGILQGMTFCPHCLNLNVNYMDDVVGPQVALYRRIGDDFILMDKNKDKLIKIKEYLEKEVKKINLKFNEEKGQFGNITNMTFDFHGLQYKDGLVQFPQKSINRITQAWKVQFRYNPNHSEKVRIRKLKEFLWLDKKEKNQYFAQYARAYQFVTDTEQVQYLSKRYFDIITKFFTGKLSFKAKKQTKKILKKCPFTTLPKHHYLRSNGIVK
jgi:retron-type reverse transcriptase